MATAGDMERTGALKQMSKTTRLGGKFGHILLHAAEKQATVDSYVLANAPRNAYWKIGAVRDGISVNKWLEREREIQENKLAWHKRNVELLLNLGMIIKLVDLENDLTIIGEPKIIDLRSASLSVHETETENNQAFIYAESVPIPEGLQQSYYGHSLTVDFEVLTIPKRNERYLA